MRSRSSSSAAARGRLDAQRLQRFITAFQSVTPLTMGELWAWPSALKLALVEHVRVRADVLAATAHPSRAWRTGSPVPCVDTSAIADHALAAPKCIRRSSPAAAAIAGVREPSALRR